MRFAPFFLASVLVSTSLFACGGDDGGDGDGGSGTDGGTPVDTDGVHEGIATYYDADGSGACSFDASSDLDVAALNAAEWSGSAYCGACVDVTRPEGNVRVRIVDLCPECKKGHLDLSESAFVKVAAKELGRVDIEWQFVSCDVSGPMKYKYKDGSNQWWTAVQIRNHRYPIQKVEWSADGTNFSELSRTDYNYFLAESGFGADPVTLRITATNGDVVEDELPAVQDSLEVEGTQQFD